MASLSPKTGLLGTHLAAHLLRRTCFNYTKKRVDEFAGKTVDEAITQLMAAPPSLEYDEPIDPKTGQPWINTPEPAGVVSSGFEKKYFHMGYWFNELIQDTTINMKMAFFLHTNFSTSWLVAGSSENDYDHHQLLRQFARGNFKTLTKKITLDNLMLLYLNNNQNRVAAPNENYARELLELFTIGKGPQIGPGNYTNYTEDDVRAAAKVLTGFINATRTSQYQDPDTGLYAGRAYYPYHDTTDKTFSAAFNNGTTIAGATSQADMYRELDDFLDMIFDQIETARHICRKLYRHFVHTDINAEIESDIIEPLADVFKNNGYELAPVLEMLFKSTHFYNEDNYGMSNKIIGGMIKSPLEILAHTIKFFNVQLPHQQTNAPTFYNVFSNGFLRGAFFNLTGFMLNAPDTVASYPAYHQSPQWDNSWFISSTIIPRYKVGQMFITNRRVLTGGAVGTQMDSVAYIEDPLNVSDPGDAITVVDEMIKYLFPESPAQERFDYFLGDIFLEGLNELNWMFEWQYYSSNQNDDSDVRIPLDALITALLGTPEFQLM